MLLALWWLLAQLRRARLAEVLVDSGDGEGALLRGRALEAVLAGEAESLDGVSRAQVAPGGPPDRARGAGGAAPGAACLSRPGRWPGWTGEALAHARDSAGLAELPAEVRLRAVKHRARRVS